MAPPLQETVRKAADIACDALHKITVRACDGVTMTSTGVRVVEGVLPVLLRHGLTNPSDEIKAISLRSILKISKNAVSLGGGGGREKVEEKWERLG